MTRFLLVRHAEHDLAGRALAGRLPALTLNARGRAQAEALAARIAPHAPRFVYSSPQPRAVATAAPVAAQLQLPVQAAAEFDEVDFGSWTGVAFDTVRAQDPQGWACWVDRRSQATPPGGEPFAEVRRRACAGIDALCRAHPQEVVLVVSHCDVIRAVLAAHLAIPLDDLERFEIGCASISILDASDGWSQVKLLNG